MLSDVSLIEFETLMGGAVPLSEYEAHEFRRLAEQNIADPVQRALAGEFVELPDVVPGNHDGDLGIAEACSSEVLQRAHRHGVGPGAADGVVDLGGGAVE